MKTKKKLTAEILALSPEQKDKLLKDIIVDCVFDGWELDMTSPEIMDTIVDAVEEAGVSLRSDEA